MLFNVVPTLIEILLVCGDPVAALRLDASPPSPSRRSSLYVAFTFSVTDWRVRFRREMNERDSEANTKAVDSLLNFETVKYFANEAHEARRYDRALAGLRARRGQERDDAGAAQCRPGRDHRLRPDRGDDAGRRTASPPGG